MRRREFIAVLGSVAAAAPLVARAQQPDRMKRIGMLMSGVSTDADRQSWIRAFVRALRNLGWVDGQNVLIDIRWNDGDAERARTHAAELARLSTDLILASSTPNLAEALRATRTIPIVFNLVSDPVAQGFVPNLQHPGGNATGFVNYEFSIAGKWLDLLKQIAPGLARVAVVFNPETSPQSKFFLSFVEATAPSLGVEVIAAPVHDTGDIKAAIESLSGQPNGGLILPNDIFTLSIHQKLIVELAARHRLPSIASLSDFVRGGGLVSYDIPLVEQFRGAAFYVDRVLKGEKPGDLPVQLPTKYQLMINLKTATSLGIELPMGLMLSADEVIE